jgi:hypothetical protein
MIVRTYSNINSKLQVSVVESSFKCWHIPSAKIFFVFVEPESAFNHIPSTFSSVHNFAYFLNRQKDR